MNGSLKYNIIYALAIGVALCAVAFYVAITNQFSGLLNAYGLCEHVLIDQLFSCMDYPDIKLGILAIVAGTLLLLGIVSLYHRRAAAIILAILYSAFLFISFVLNTPAGYSVFGEYNFVPFKTIFTHLSGEPTWIVAWNNLAGNFVPFMLLGLLLPLTTKRPLEGTLVAAISLGIGAATELAQAAFQMGVFDIDDIILNALGVAIGYLIFTMSANYLRRFRDKYDDLARSNR